jgi:hypothetical protein
MQAVRTSASAGLRQVQRRGYASVQSGSPYQSTFNNLRINKDTKLLVQGYVYSTNRRLELMISASRVNKAPSTPNKPSNTAPMLLEEVSFTRIPYQLHLTTPSKPQESRNHPPRPPRLRYSKGRHPIRRRQCLSHLRSPTPSGQIDRGSSRGRDATCRVHHRRYSAARYG